ncbi:hypothetical protein WA026_008266 [Henosepilachna vigintioctopunctata]|uniref:Uncharacterized protein n=1 Tax=Henosepilachna vigintioctopunctata TaxID=420089 RepID=A0AAW1TK05_9CUCU
MKNVYEIHISISKLKIINFKRRKFSFVTTGCGPQVSDFAASDDELVSCIGDLTGLRIYRNMKLEMVIRVQENPDSLGLTKSGSGKIPFP